MINVQQTASRLARMPDPALQQYAMMHKNDPYTVSLALFESNRRKEMRAAAQGQQGMGEQPKVVDQGIAGMMPPQPQMAQRQAQAMPEDLGIATLNAPNMETMAAAEGGIVGYADGGPIAFAKAGVVRDPLAQYEEQIRREAVRQGVDPDMAMRLFKAESAGNTTAVSTKGATGLGQLMVDAAAEMGLKPEERTDPAKNIPASIGYFKKQLNTFKDPEKALAAYNWGPGNVQKHLAKNEGRLNKAGLPKETADYITKILPVGTAYAAPSSTEETRRAALIAQIPGQTAPAPAPAATGIASVTPGSVPASADDAASRIPGAVPFTQTQTGPAPTGNDIVKGTAKTAFALGQNTLAVPAAGISTLARRAFGDPTANFEETLGRYSYSPNDAVSQQQLEGIGKAMRDLKIPAYMPMLGGVAGASRAGAAKDAAAIAKAAPLRLTNETAGTPQAIAAAAADAAKKSKAAVTDARVLPGVSPESQGVIQLNKNRLEARYPELQATATADETAAALARANADKTQRAAAANLATDEAAATAARARTATTNAGAQAVNESLPGVTNRSILGGNVATGVNAANLYPDAGAAGGISDLGVDPNAAFRQSERDFRKMGDELPKEFKKEAIDLAKDAVPKKERKGFTNDDYLTLGLGLLANKSSSFAQALGEAGLGTLKFQKERTKDEREAESDLIKNKYYGALARQADAMAGSYESGDRMMPQALKAGNDAYDDWFKSLSPIQQMELKPGQAEAKRQELLQLAMLQFRMKAGTGVAIPEGVKVNRVG